MSSVKLEGIATTRDVFVSTKSDKSNLKVTLDKTKTTYLTLMQAYRDKTGTPVENQKFIVRTFEMPKSLQILLFPIVHQTVWWFENGSIQLAEMGRELQTLEADKMPSN